ncbi:interleukin-15 receptor subunit alpha-like isoform X1 [Scyliorhinus canicula]|uniref:interleukin-15 receptor subunit alpha-like isoform X1 n=1 Tax=Scyliorhinus canicula TaxID=7830 RepID=UPI0018F434D7|nr:interleukin-15 receptor subunit alpha-like isoform X1 [Scyliorhinus canicula]
MAGIKQLLVLCSILQATLAFKGSCSKPDFKVENVDLSEIMDTLFEVGQRLRLKCQSGYKRKAGTSNLIRCENNTQQIMWSKPNLMCITLTSLATSVESTSVESPPSAPTAGSISDHFTASTMDITVTTGSHLSSAMTTLTVPIESTTLTATPTSVSGCNQTSSSPPGNTATSGLGPLATAWTAVRPSTPSASTAETEFEATVPSATTLKAAAETTVTNSIHGTTGTEPVTTRRAVTERTVKPTTASETASDVTVTLGTSDTNITAGKNIGLIVGTSAGSLFFITICVLLLLWVIVFQHKISCTRSQEYELAPMPSTEVQAVTNINETEPLQQETES